MPKKLEVKDELIANDFVDMAAPIQTEKEKLLALHKQLTDLGVNRISQLENLIAKAE